MLNKNSYDDKKLFDRLENYLIFIICFFIILVIIMMKALYPNMLLRFQTSREIMTT